ncbi:putative signal-recognition-particle GTPase [Helianthus anomalus]
MKSMAACDTFRQRHDINVMMAACDTFRSGAVEQLRTHARRLLIPIFEKVYEKDPAILLSRIRHSPWVERRN